MQTYTCAYCKKEFKDYPSNRYGKIKCCTRKCKGLYQSTRYLGKNNPCWRGGIPKCIDCGKELTQRFYKRCGKCDLKTGDHRRIDGLSHTKEYVSKKNREWGQNNKTKRREMNLKRKGIILNAEGSHTYQEWEKLKKTYKYMCLCCKRQEPEIKLTEDHIIPLSKGGADYIWNIQPLCQSCNARKRVKTTDFRKDVIRV